MGAGLPVVQLVHSGAVGIGGQGVLLTGIGGSGQSTTCLLCLEAGLDFAGDDYTAFELVGGSSARVHSLYSSAKVDPVTLGRFPRLRQLVSNPHAATRRRSRRSSSWLAVSRATTSSWARTSTGSPGSSPR